MMVPSPPTPPQTNILRLSPELLTEVWQYLAHKELKTIRLTCRTFEQTASSALFRTFILYAHTKRLDDLEALSRISHIASHIRDFVYDDRFGGALKCALKDHSSLSHQGAGDGKARALIRRLIDRSVTCGLVDQLELSMSLQQILPLLPNVRTIKILEAEQFPELPRIPRFYRRILGSALSLSAQRSIPTGWEVKDYDDVGSAAAILASASFLVAPLRRLELSTSTLGWLSKGSPLGKSPRCSQAFVALDELSLVFIEDFHRVDCRYMRYLQPLLKRATNLSKLTLVMGQLDKNTYHPKDKPPDRSMYLTFRMRDRAIPWYEDEQETTPLQPRLTWSDKIRSLELGHLWCDVRELGRVLVSHSKNLVSLKLSDLMLQPAKAGSKSPRACLVTFIKWLQRHFNLKQVAFAGTLTNYGMQHWIVDGRTQLGLHKRIATFITDGGACPLESLRIPREYFDVGMRSHNAPIPPYSLFEEIFDEGWEMEHPDFFAKPTDICYSPDSGLLHENGRGD